MRSAGCGLRVLDLSRNKLTIEDVGAMAKVLGELGAASGAGVRAAEEEAARELVLNLADNPLGDIGWAAFARCFVAAGAASQVALSPAPAGGMLLLVSLDLSNTWPVTARGVSVLAAGLQRNRQLKRLQLRYNRLGPMEATKLAQALMHEEVQEEQEEQDQKGKQSRVNPRRLRPRALESLDLQGNPILDEGLRAIIDAMIHLPCSTHSGGSCSLMELRVGECSITDLGVRYLVGALACTPPPLHSTQGGWLKDLKDEDRPALDDSLAGYEFRRKKLVSSGSGSGGGQSVAEGGRVLTSLSLCDNTSIKFEGVALLAHLLRHPTPSMVDLQELDLSGITLGGGGAYTLARALPWAPSLTSLDIERCKIEAYGAIALAEAFQFAFVRYCRQRKEGERAAREQARQRARAAREEKGAGEEGADEKRYQEEERVEAEQAAAEAEERRSKSERQGEGRTSDTDYLEYYCDGTHSTTPRTVLGGASEEGEGRCEAQWPPSLSLTSLNLRGNRMGAGAVDALVSSVWGIPPVRVKGFRRREELERQPQLGQEERGLRDPNEYMDRAGVVTEEEEQTLLTEAEAEARAEAQVEAKADSEAEADHRSYWPRPTPLQHLNLEQNLIGQRGCRALARLLQRDYDNAGAGSEGASRSVSHRGAGGSDSHRGTRDANIQDAQKAGELGFGWVRNICSSLRTVSVSQADLETRGTQHSPYSQALRGNEGLTITTSIPLNMTTRIAFLRYCSPSTCSSKYRLTDSHQHPLMCLARAACGGMAVGRISRRGCRRRCFSLCSRICMGGICGW
jgi:Ran GTPase-activating protein (RanGAP) involved in mRNA processing and transport